MAFWFWINEIITEIERKDFVNFRVIFHWLTVFFTKASVYLSISIKCPKEIRSYEEMKKNRKGRMEEVNPEKDINYHFSTKSWHFLPSYNDKILHDSNYEGVGCNIQNSVVYYNFWSVAEPFSSIHIKVVNIVIKKIGINHVQIMGHRNGWIGNIQLPGHFFFLSWFNYDLNVEDYSKASSNNLFLGLQNGKNHRGTLVCGDVVVLISVFSSCENFYK